MTNARTAVLLFALAASFAASGGAGAQKLKSSPKSDRQPVLSLTFANNGQRLTARVGQQIEISLGTIGPRQYGMPEISSPAIQLMNTAQEWPPTPGGPRFIYVSRRPPKERRGSKSRS